MMKESNCRKLPQYAWSPDQNADLSPSFCTGASRNILREASARILLYRFKLFGAAVCIKKTVGEYTASGTLQVIASFSP